MRMKARRKHLREEGADEGSRRLAEDAEEDAERRDVLLQQQREGHKHPKGGV